MDPQSDLTFVRDLVSIRDELVRHDLDSVIWWRHPPVVVKVLLVTDGALDFGIGDFGLQTFVTALLNDGRFYVRFELTLAHLRSDVAEMQMMSAEPRISRRIKDFRFDNPENFAPDMYDEVWLFGFETSFHIASYATRNSDRRTYPAERLGDAELVALSEHMNSGRGIFATGDHGSLGRGLCGSVSRVRKMRRWESFVIAGEDEVGMINARRNDTNRIGNDPGTQFSDQSDDIPQILDLLLYSSRLGFFQNARYPHPVLCSKFGRIDVFPDHPHEGECIASSSLDSQYPFDGSEEWPAGIGPEIIATSRVPSGNTARSTKMPTKVATQAHSFGAVCAYDGHRAGVGRVVTDATWHHFVNVNLIGVVEGGGFDEFAAFPDESTTKHSGFLATSAGAAAFRKIKEYYVNLGVWLATPELISSFNSHFWLDLVYTDRLMESTLLTPHVEFESIRPNVFYYIGVHARDVLGRKASPCQTVEFLLDWLKLVWVEVIDDIDPWASFSSEQTRAPLPWYDLQPLIDTAIGGALVAVRQAMPYPSGEASENQLKGSVDIAVQGGRRALAIALREAIEDHRALGDLLNNAAHSMPAE
ncbi:hypothetical protein [Nocardia rhamnosiphila]|uniref:Uncharacterized protein n=1 Tax=Nocardia rhamnosiphila TaxID=426716 RepID=A0ABV2WXN1_9NOCA